MRTGQAKILLVEDDPILGEGLTISLKLEGYEVKWCKTFQDSKTILLNENFDLIVLDINLPDGLGTELCRLIRLKNLEVGIIFLTAKTDEETVVQGLELGANDFVKKPFSHRELMARVKALLRGKLKFTKDIRIGELIVLPEKRQVFFKEEAVNLNRRQFDILAYFISLPDHIITRDQLLSHLDQDGSIYDRTMDSHISQLRKILKESGVSSIQITSIYGIGYRLEILE